MNEDLLELEIISNDIYEAIENKQYYKAQVLSELLKAKISEIKSI